MGFVIVVVMSLYLLISLGVVAGAVSYAKKRGRSAKRWGWGAAFIMYSLVFWDWIPTVAVHQYYCTKDSGFWVYKTLDQWKAENPGGMEGLIDNSPQEKYPNWPSENWDGKIIYNINQRIGLLYTDHLSNSQEGDENLNVWRWQIELVDKQTSQVLARKVDFSSGNDGYIGGMQSMKFWLKSEGCIGSKELSRKFNEFLQQFRGVRK